ncbi:MAG TPA: hypothetical protein VM687_10835 [Stenotrophomonas sp.]|nr:hypothetical protein [Stenotrophomonas sp.]
MRGVLRGFGWLVAGGCALLLGGYGLLLLINARDEAPSAETRQLAERYAQRGQVPDADNGFIYLLGIDAPAEQKPALGRRRKAAIEALQTAPPVHDMVDLTILPGARSRTVAARSPALRALLSACTDDYVRCAAALDDGAAPLAVQWLDEEAGLRARYQELIALPQWQELDAAGQVSFPPYPAALDGQRLLLLEAWLAARAGQEATVLQLLDQDLRFWRRVLRDTDTLIGKMIATTAINRHFGIGNLIMRAMGRRHSQALPASWQMPLTKDERSTARAMTGEWRYTQWYQQAALSAPVSPPEVSAGERVLDLLQRPLFKPQATSNLLAARFVRLGDASAADYRILPSALAQADVSAPGSPWRWLFNPTGRIGVQIADGIYVPYALRVADLEGARRVAVEAATLRAQGVDANSMHRALATPAAQRDPYTAQPLRWDARTGVISVSSHDPRPGIGHFLY